LPVGLLKEIVKTPIGNKTRGIKVTRLLKQRALFAVNTSKGG